ncbi:MAG: phenylacetate--CoA ligase [Clostridiales bacterium]|nr:phenylacetate--CoA ligase [Clostridiales bacterium]
MYYNPLIETMPREELNKLQLERLQSTVKRVYEKVEPYRNKMDQKGVKPEDIRSLADIKYLPFNDKTDLRDFYPNKLFAVPMTDIVRIHASSGTTGKPIVVGYTKKDLESWAEVMARSLACAHGSNEDIVQVSYGYGLFTGGLGAHGGAEHLGATVIPTSGGNSKRQIMMMTDLGTTMLCCTPSYAINLGETIRDMGIDKSQLKLKSGIFGAEPWTEAMRAQIEELLGLKAYDIYGLSEMIGPGVAMECDARKGLHIWEDQFIAEVVDPATGEPLPEGTKGELVFTTINKEGIPMLRYRTHDLTTLHYEKCDCGRTHVRMEKVMGRTDDMLIIRGVNVFPSQVEAALVGMEYVSPHYMLVVDRVGTLDTLEVMVEIAQLPADGDTVRILETLNRKISAALQQALGISVKVRLVEPGTIQRSEGKAKRVIDNRNYLK